MKMKRTNIEHHKAHHLRITKKTSQSIWYNRIKTISTEKGRHKIYQENQTHNLAHQNPTKNRRKPVQFLGWSSMTDHIHHSNSWFLFSPFLPCEIWSPSNQSDTNKEHSKQEKQTKAQTSTTGTRKKKTKNSTMYLICGADANNYWRRSVQESK